MERTPNGWEVIDAKLPALMFTYSFGPGVANALAVGIEDGLAVISPPCRVSSDVMDDLAAYGPVKALVASNAFHHMGLSQWVTRFPEASIFAPLQSVARVEKQSGIRGIRALSELGPLAGKSVQFVDMPHYRTGEALVVLQTDSGRSWYVTDIVMNMPELPKHPIVRAVFKWTNSAPGLKLNNVGPTFMVKDKKALLKWFRDKVDQAPPNRLLPTHGKIVEVTPQQLKALFGGAPS